MFDSFKIAIRQLLTVMVEGPQLYGTITNQSLLAGDIHVRPSLVLSSLLSSLELSDKKVYEP